MQTIKCVVVGDGAVGKVRIPPFIIVSPIIMLNLVRPSIQDLSLDLLHYKQIPE